MTHIVKDPNGQKAMANSLSVTVATDQTPVPVNDSAKNALLGAINEAAPATDIADSGLNGRLKRVAQNITTLIGKLPSLIGKRAKADSLSVTIASDEGNLPVSDTTNGGKLDTLATKVDAVGTKVDSVGTKVDTVAVNIGAPNEAIPSNETINSGINGRLRYLTQLLRELVGATNETVANSDTDVRGINGLLKRNNQNTTQANVLLGDTSAAAPASDIATSSINGRLQRIAQNITLLIGKLPPSLGGKTSSQSLSVTVATDQTVPVSVAGTVPVSMAGTVATSVSDGGSVTLGAKGDTPASSDTANASEMAFIKRLVAKFQADLENSVLTNTSRIPVGGKAVDLAALTAITDGNASMLRFDKETGALVCTIGDIKSIWDSMTIAEKTIKSPYEFTRPANTTGYIPGDMIYSSVVAGDMQFTGVSTGSATGDGGGYITALRFMTEDTATIGKKLALGLYESGNFSLIDNDPALSIPYSVQAAGKIATIEIDKIVATISGTFATCELLDLRIPFKTSQTLFHAMLVTRDAYTPQSAKKYSLELTISSNL